jgi:hypothetical protein
LEKEARLVVKELWAKISAREKFVVYGAAVTVVAWLLGVILGTKSYGGGSVFGQALPSYSVNFFTTYHGMDLGLLGVLAAVAVGVVIYLRYAPNMNITWPAPVATILLGAAGVALACSALMFLLQLTSGVGVGDWPIFAWVAVIGMLAGSGIMAWFSYQEFLAAKTPVV